MEAIANLQPDVFCLQEVNQSQGAQEVKPLKNQIQIQDTIKLRQDNHAYTIVKMLEGQGIHYEWVWLPIKVGYGKYDEGVAIFSKKPILEVEDLLVSQNKSYSNYRTRRLLGIRNEDGWFYSVHFSWWADPEEPFANQWKKANQSISQKKKEPVFLLGDFNGDAAIRNENYDTIRQVGFYDTYLLAKEKDDGYTISGQIDGWRENEPIPQRRIALFPLEVRK